MDGIEISPSVLIPRPETEELVEWILLENDLTVRKSDIGTAGCIGVCCPRKLLVQDACLGCFSEALGSSQIECKNGEVSSTSGYYAKITTDILFDIL